MNEDFLKRNSYLGGGVPALAECLRVGQLSLPEKPGF